MLKKAKLHMCVYLGIIPRLHLKHFETICRFSFILADENIAFKQPTDQISTFRRIEYEGPSDKAVDGNRNTNFFEGSCTSTNNDFQPWWGG